MMWGTPRPIAQGFYAALLRCGARCAAAQPPRPAARRPASPAGARGRASLPPRFAPYAALLLYLASTAAAPSPCLPHQAPRQRRARDPGSAD